jgi:hypothetical protein
MEANSRDIFNNPSSPYRPLYEKYEKVTADMRTQETGPEAVTDMVLRVIKASRLKAPYTAGFPFSGSLVLFLGDPVWDRIVRQMLKI